jgi:histidine phosphotransferase ChpT
MSVDAEDFAGLLCARICHDLVSPVGAIGNGLELLSAEAAGDPGDLALLTDSAGAANAALTFLRLAFGAVGAGAPPMAAADLEAVARRHLGRQRHRIEFAVAAPEAPRAVAKLVCLGLMAGATGTPFGGTLRVQALSAAPLLIEIAAMDGRAGMEPDTVALVTNPASVATTPRETHLALLPREAARQGCRVSVMPQEGAVVIRIAP